MSNEPAEKRFAAETWAERLTGPGKAQAFERCADGRTDHVYCGRFVRALRLRRCKRQAVGGGLKQGGFPDAERYYSEAISLPIYQGLTDQQQNEVVRVLGFVLK